MSIICAQPGWRRGAPPAFWMERTAAALGAVLVVVATLTVASWLLARGIAPQPRNPFGLPIQEASPFAGGLGAVVIVLQAQFYAAMTSAVLALKAKTGAMTALAGIGFLYGVFHAAGPGHGKGVITAYVVSRRASVGLGLALSLAAALMQAAMAILLVGVFAVALQASTVSIGEAARYVELASFMAIAAFGAMLLWTKSGEFVETLNGVSPDDAAAVRVGGKPGMRQFLSVAAAAGVRPCSGAIILLTFSLSQELFGAGVVGALAMALGTSITTGSLAALAIMTRGAAHRMSLKGGRFGASSIAGLELLASAFVLALGAVLLSAPLTGFAPLALD